MWPSNYLVQMDRWMMGGLDVIGYRELSATLLFPGRDPVFVHGGTEPPRREDLALGHGGCALGLSAVFSAGIGHRGGGLALRPIGFVGLIVPHAVRRLAVTTTASCCRNRFFWAARCWRSATLSRHLFAPTESPSASSPPGGGPLFIRILLRKVENRLVHSIRATARHRVNLSREEEPV